MAKKEHHEIEKHLHSLETWFGISGDQSGNDWGADTLNPFVAISGAADYGGDANDEAKVIGTDDTPIVAGKKKFDIHRILVVDVDHVKPYKLRIVYATDTMANGIAAGQVSEFFAMLDATAPQLSAPVPVPIMMPRLDVGTYKIWIQCKNATNNSEIDFFVGIHEYDI